jgi:hypothetical protein
MASTCRCIGLEAHRSGDMKLRYIDWIWTISGSVALAPSQPGEETFARLAPLLETYGTSHERTADTLTFKKTDQAAQDKMSVFDGGTLQIEPAETGSVLRYRLSSRFLLFCFLAPLLFLGFAQVTIAVGKLQKPQTAAEKAEKKKEADKKNLVQNPIDKFLGAPAPEKPGKKDKQKEEEDDEFKKKFSPTADYVFAAIFGVLYVFGRVLEDWLIKALFKSRLDGSESASAGKFLAWAISLRRFRRKKGFSP